MSLKLINRLAFISFVLVIPLIAWEKPTEKITVYTIGDSTMADIDPFVISGPESVAQLVVNPNEKEFVHMVVNLFASDVLSVSGRKPEIKTVSQAPSQIWIGTLGVSPDFDRECADSGIETDSLKGKWEAYQIRAIQKRGIQKLFVVGSNPHGTAYGLMELSRIIGMSPWCWWADVKPENRETISLPGNLSLADAPKVKFRGIFLNDEDWGLQPWAAKTFEPETGDIGPKTYEKIFELLLRLKANTIWPAMHPCTKAFYTIPGNRKMAAKYQIFVGTSHAEPMLRNNVDEWDKKRFGDYDYSTNRGVVKKYWHDRIEELSKEDQYIVTLGMRGIHDSGMQGNYTSEEKVEMLETIIADQREILGNILEEDVRNIPQAFVPYKEVLEIYNNGARIPDDVTLIWPDDNHGYIRRLSNTEERKRAGGAGVYYHISYWGRPHDFLWLESVPVSLIWEEMHKAYRTNAKNIWIVNVGDIKPNEIGMNFFLEMAWNPDRFSPENLDSYYSRFAAFQFGVCYAEEIGEILRKYFQLGYSRKPEHMGWNGVYPNTQVQDPELSLFHNGDEVQQRIEAYDSLEKQVEALYEKIPERLKGAFYQLVAYKVIGASNMNKKILSAYKSRVYAQQGRVSANMYAQKAEEAFEKIKKSTAVYNDSIAGGKWKHMMAFNPRELPVFDMPPTGGYTPDIQHAGGIIPEGYSSVVDTRSRVLSLPAFSSLTNRSYFVDVFNEGIQPLNWEVETNDWINVSKSSGQTGTEERVWVSIDWNLVPSADSVKSVIRFKLNGSVYPVNVVARRPKLELAGKNVFVKDNGVISIEAEDYTILHNTSGCSWQTIQGLGRESNAIGAFPITEKAFDIAHTGSASVLSYDFYTASEGDIKLYFYCIPTLPINEDYQLRFSASIDNESPIIINAALKEEMEENNPEWKNNVLSSVTIQKVDSKIHGQGNHSLNIRMIDPGVVIDKIEVVMKEKKNTYFGVPETGVAEFE